MIEPDVLRGVQHYACVGNSTMHPSSGNSNSGKTIVQAEYRLSPNEIIEFRHRLNIANAIVKFVVEVFSGGDKCRQSIKAQPDSKVPKWCLGVVVATAC